MGEPTSQLKPEGAAAHQSARDQKLNDLSHLFWGRGVDGNSVSFLALSSTLGSYSGAAPGCYLLSPYHFTSLCMAYTVSCLPAVPSSTTAAKQRQGSSVLSPAKGWAWGLQERNKSKLNLSAIWGMLAGSWKTGIKHICVVAKGCLHLQLHLFPGEGAELLVVPRGLSSSEFSGTFFSFLLASRPQPELLDADTAIHQQCSYHLDIQHQSLHMSSTLNQPEISWS